MKSIHTYLSLLAVVVLGSSCASTSQVSNVNTSSKSGTIQSQDDLGSPIHSLQKQGALADLKRTLKEKVKKNPRDIKSKINLAHIYLAQNNTIASEKLCKQALKFNRNSKDAKLLLAQINYRKGYRDLAEIILNSLGSRVEKDSIALNLKALIALQNDYPAKAMYFFKQALRYNPSDIAARMNLGVLYMYYRQIDAAAVQFERVQKIMPSNVDAKLHLAVIMSSRGQIDKAEDLYDEVLAADPGNAVATYNLAVLEEKRDNLDKSLSHVRDFLGTPYAKQHNNKEVFAMIDRIRTKKEIKGDSLSDSEIQEMAAQLNSGGGSDDKEEVADEFVKPEPASSFSAKQFRDGKDEEKKKPKKRDDIDSLEKELFK